MTTHIISHLYSISYKRCPTPDINWFIILINIDISTINPSENEVLFTNFANYEAPPSIESIFHSIPYYSIICPYYSVLCHIIPYNPMYIP